MRFTLHSHNTICEAHITEAIETRHRPPISVFVFVACGVWLIGLGLYFMLWRPALLPEDARYIGDTTSHIRSALPGLEHWARRVFTVLGGFMMGAGALTILGAINMSVAPTRWAWGILAATGLSTVATMSLVNFQLDSDFKWLLLAPSLAWAIALALYRYPTQRHGLSKS